MTCEAKLLTRRDLEDAMEPLSADAESLVLGHIAALTAEVDKSRAVLAAYLGRPLMDKDTVLVLAEGAVARGNTSEDELARAESERDAAREMGSAVSAKLLALERERDAAQQEAHRLSNALALEQTTRDRAVGEADTLRERVATLEGTLATEDQERIRCRDGWALSEARVKGLTEALSLERNALDTLYHAVSAGREGASMQSVLGSVERVVKCRGASQPASAPVQVSDDAALAERLHKSRWAQLPTLLTLAATCATPGCGKPAACWGAYEAPYAPWAPACDDCCGHGNEDGHCERIEPTPTLPALVEAVGRILPALAHVERVADGRVAQARADLLLAITSLRAAYDAAKGGAAPKESGLAEERGDTLELVSDILDCDMDRAAPVAAVTAAHEDAATYRAAVERAKDADALARVYHEGQFNGSHRVGLMDVATYVLGLDTPPSGGGK